MAKKYLSLERLAEYDELIKSKIDTGDDSTLASAKSYADNAAAKVKNDLLNGAGTAYDTLKELADLIDVNVDAIDALETVAANKADKTHTHAIADVTNLQSLLDEKVPTSRTINNKALSANITLSATDIGAYTKAEIDAMEFITVDDIDTICNSTN